MIEKTVINNVAFSLSLSVVSLILEDPLKY